MKHYSKLKLPKDSAWDRKFLWGKFINWRIRYFFKGIKNIIRWSPTIYKDRDWDNSYILTMLQKKIEHQRAYLVKCNRYTKVDTDNFWMTVVLNLLERENQDFYTTEKYSFEDSEIVSTPMEDTTSYVLINIEVKNQNWEEYLKKYPSTVRKVKKDKPELSMQQLTFWVAHYNQEKCRKLLFNILERKIRYWWD